MEAVIIYMHAKTLSHKKNRIPKISYDISSLVLLFFVLAVIGWFWEVFLFWLQSGSFAKRGILSGPWLPIYGTGGLAMLLLLKPLFDRPVLTFFSAMTLSSILEYATSCWMEYQWGNRWWDYSSYSFNLNGRICLIGALLFGMAGMVLIYGFAPRILRFFLRIPRQLRTFLCVFLLLLFSLDCVSSYFHPNMGRGITTYLSIDSDCNEP